MFARGLFYLGSLTHEIAGEPLHLVCQAAPCQQSTASAPRGGHQSDVMSSKHQERFLTRGVSLQVLQFTASPCKATQK